MEEEEVKPLIPAGSLSQEQLRQLLIATYRARTPADTHAAQLTLTHCFQREGFTEQLASLIVGAEQSSLASTQSKSRRQRPAC
jgi:hypothetical protein